MALIRCPNCDTLHDLEGSFFASGARKVRCASCRTIWEATDPESSTGPSVVIPRPEPNFAPPDVAEEAAAPAEVETAALDQNAIDSMDFSTPEPPAQEGADISAAELEALFADEAKPADTEPKPAEVAAAPTEFDPDSLARAQDAARAAAREPAGEERRKWRRAKHLAANDAHQHQGKPARKSNSTAVMLMAAGVGTLATLGILRNEAVRLFPASAPIFEAVGLSVNPGTLDIAEVRSRLVKEEGRETLEVTGTVTNLTKSQQKIPVMRLSIRSNTGQEIYVWTATTDQPELGPSERTVFRRRLASPPAESHSVMVRFVAKDDIVAAIR